MGAGHKHGGAPAGASEGPTDWFDLLREPDYTLDLRIAAIFVIFACSLLGSVPPIFITRSTQSVLGGIVRAFSAGVILALALVHVYPHAAMDLEELTPFPVAGTCTVFGVLLLVAIEHGLNTMLSHKHKHEHAPPTTEKAADVEVDAHTHACLNHNSTAGWLKSADDVGSLRQQVLAYMMEIGCVFHSVLIGVGVGVLVDDRTQVTALVIALSFHQFLEGISLGSVVNVAGFAKLKGLSMVLLYSLTTPIGIAIGIGIASTYDPSSVTAIAVQGVLSAVAGGMLLYIALIQLIGEEFSRQELLERNGLKFAMLISLTVGAASMCMLAIWA